MKLKSKLIIPVLLSTVCSSIHVDAAINVINSKTDVVWNDYIDWRVIGNGSVFLNPDPLVQYYLTKNGKEFSVSSSGSLLKFDSLFGPMSGQSFISTWDYPNGIDFTVHFQQPVCALGFNLFGMGFFEIPQQYIGVIEVLDQNYSVIDVVEKDLSLVSDSYFGFSSDIRDIHAVRIGAFDTSGTIIGFELSGIDVLNSEKTPSGKVPETGHCISLLSIVFGVFRVLFRNTGVRTDQQT